jgi:hypothetical protein
VSIWERWPTAESFYAERDHRTEIEVESLRRYVDTPIEIHVSELAALSPAIQQMALTAANLTSRWARRISVFVPQVKLERPLSCLGDHSLADRIAREMREADPFGNFKVEGPNRGDRRSLRIFVGSSEQFEIGDRDYCISADRWMALGRRGRQFEIGVAPSAVAPAAALAGALGASDLFKRAIGHSTKEWLHDLIWCTWDHEFHTDVDLCRAPAVPSSGEFGNVLLAGVGAIGSALLYILGMVGGSGNLTLLDRDGVETSNLNRSPLFTAKDAAEQRRKVDVGQDFLRRIGIGANVIHGPWREVADSVSGQRFDVWVSLTNEDGAWSEVPYHLPPPVLHGTTTSGWGIGFGRHLPGIEDCTGCRLPQPHAQFRGPCAQGVIAEPAEQKQIRASLPFLSTVPGALIAAELLKLNYAQAPSLPNLVQADFRFGVPFLVALRVLRNPQCRGCQSWNEALWSARGGRSRFAAFSQQST